MKNLADFIIAVTGNRIECELRGVQDLFLTPRLKLRRCKTTGLHRCPCNSDYKENPQGIRSNLF